MKSAELKIGSGLKTWIPGNTIFSGITLMQFEQRFATKTKNGSMDPPRTLDFENADICEEIIKGLDLQGGQTK